MTATIISNIDARLKQAKAEIIQLEDARKALVNGTSTATTSPVRTKSAETKAAPKPRRARRKPAEPKYQVVPAGKLTAALTHSAGMTTPELAKATDGRPMQVLRLLRELESAGEIRRSGNRRSTRWHLMTDEDRVAARAAEIEARTKAPRRRARRR